MNKILITGSTGFVGKNVKEYLEKKECIVLAPSSKQLDCLLEEQVKNYLKKEKVNIVLHFAVYGDGIDKSKDGTKIAEYNLRMYLNFAKYNSLYDKMIYTGSGAEFDKHFPITMVTEEQLGESIPTDTYGVMKYTVNQMIEASDNIYNLRLFGIFGKYEYWQTKFISNICCKAVKGLPLSIRQNCKFDYLYIEDFCGVLYKFMQIDKPKYHSYNAVHGKPVELTELAEIVQNLSSKNNIPLYVCNEGYANEYTASNERLLREIGDFEFTDIKESVKELYQWYEEHKDEIDLYSLIYG